MVISDGVAAARCKAMIAEVLSGLVSPRATEVAPKLSSVLVIASSINCAICGEIDAGSIAFATLLISPPATPMAPPTRLSQFLILVLSYTYFGQAERIIDSIDIANALFMKIWFGIRPVIMA